MEPNSLSGFRKELVKLAEPDPKAGLQGAALGAVVGAVIGGVSPLILSKMLSRNADLAAILGAIAGAGTLGSAAFLLGRRQPQLEKKSSFTASASLASKIRGVGAKIVSTPSAHVAKSGVARASAKMGRGSFLKTFSPNSILKAASRKG